MLDAFFFRSPEGYLKLRPVSEINTRYTMGRVALELSRTTPQNSATSFAIRSTGSPLPVGTVPLTAPSAARRYVATLSVTT